MLYALYSPGTQHRHAVRLAADQPRTLPVRRCAIQWRQRGHLQQEHSAGQGIIRAGQAPSAPDTQQER